MLSDNNYVKDTKRIFSWIYIHLKMFLFFFDKNIANETHNYWYKLVFFRKLKI